MALIGPPGTATGLRGRRDRWHASFGPWCAAQIAHELRYQSSMDLDEATYEAVTRMPLAREAVEESRTDLVRRLDDYCLSHHETFLEVRPGE